MQYTTGNWTVASLTQDTISQTKNIVATDIDFANDYTIASASPSEVVLQNKTGNALTPMEQIRYGRTNLADIYRNTDITPAMRDQNKTGLRLLSEVTFKIKATNSVSGDEELLPFRGWVVLETPKSDLVTADAIAYLQQRVVSAMYETGKVDETLVANIARGDLNPQM